MPSDTGMSSEKRESEEVTSPLPWYYQEPFLLACMHGKNLLLFVYFTAGSLPGGCMCKLPLET